MALASVNGNLGGHGVAFSGAGGPSNKAEFWVTKIYRTVDYGFGAGGGAGEQFVDMIGPLVGFLIGGNLLLREMPRLSAYMKARHRKWLRPDEYEVAWRALRAQKHAAWSV